LLELLKIKIYMSKIIHTYTQKNIEYTYLIDDTNVVTIILFSISKSFDKKSVVLSTKFAHG